MTVAELKEILNQFSDDTTVRFSYDYGDHCHHFVAHEVKFVDLQPVKKSDYVDDFVIDDYDDGDFIEDEKYAVVLS